MDRAVSAEGKKRQSVRRRRRRRLVDEVLSLASEGLVVVMCLGVWVVTLCRCWVVLGGGSVALDRLELGMGLY